MIKKISYIIYKIFVFIDKILRFLTKRSILIWFKDFFHEESYKELSILEKKINFFIPNQLTEWRVNTFFSKEPETLEWIDNFSKDSSIFWDIGANIGLYSIYNSIKNKNSTTIAFEPSTSNLRVLTRNISINNLEKNIKLFPLPLTNKQNSFLQMNENNFIEGGALNTFGETYNFEGQKFESEMKYTILGTSINYLLENKILEIPDYIKIDVDGIEHLILEGGNKFLNSQKIKSLSIEINENFKNQFEMIIKIMEENNFKILHKKNNINSEKNTKFSNTFNYVFIRKNN